MNGKTKEVVTCEEIKTKDVGGTKLDKKREKNDWEKKKKARTWLGRIWDGVKGEKVTDAVSLQKKEICKGGEIGRLGEKKTKGQRWGGLGVFFDGGCSQNRKMLKGSLLGVHRSKITGEKGREWAL